MENNVIPRKDAAPEVKPSEPSAGPASANGPSGANVATSVGNLGYEANHSISAGDGATINVDNTKVVNKTATTNKVNSARFEAAANAAVKDTEASKSLEDSGMSMG